MAAEAEAERERNLSTDCMIHPILSAAERQTELKCQANNNNNINSTTVEEEEEEDRTTRGRWRTTDGNNVKGSKKR